MADRPIIFSAPMVQALVAGHKTQTRRLLPARHPRCPHHNHICMDALTFDPQQPTVWYWDGVHDRVGASYCLPYAPGDRLWVREAWRASSAYDDLAPSQMGGEESVRYEASGVWQTWGWPIPHKTGRYRPARFMPRWASRLTLHVSEVRVQRLQEISEEDARAEGVTPADEPNERKWQHYSPHGVAFRSLWNSLHGPGAWDANPWCVAVSFTVQRGNIDAL